MIFHRVELNGSPLIKSHVASQSASTDTPPKYTILVHFRSIHKAFSTPKRLHIVIGLTREYNKFQ